MTEYEKFAEWFGPNTADEWRRQAGWLIWKESRRRALFEAAQALPDEKSECEDQWNLGYEAALDHCKEIVIGLASSPQ